ERPRSLRDAQSDDLAGEGELLERPGFQPADPFPAEAELPADLLQSHGLAVESEAEADHRLLPLRERGDGPVERLLLEADVDLLLDPVLLPDELAELAGAGGSRRADRLVEAG